MPGYGSDRAFGSVGVRARKLQGFRWNYVVVYGVQVYFGMTLNFSI
jgi:hypothetical protein